MSIGSAQRTDEGLARFIAAAKSGVRKASEAMDTMSASAVKMDVVSAGDSPTEWLGEVAGNPEDLVAGVYIEVTGEVPGHALLAFSYESALALIDLASGRNPGDTKELGEMEASTMQEIGNIITSSYLNAISDFYGWSLMPSPPSLAVDMAAAVIDSVLLNASHCDEEPISIVTRFEGNNCVLHGFFLYIPDIVLA